jgi:hypothetical protein
MDIVYLLEPHGMPVVVSYDSILSQKFFVFPDIALEPIVKVRPTSSRINTQVVLLICGSGGLKRLLVFRRVPLRLGCLPAGSLRPVDAKLPVSINDCMCLSDLGLFEVFRG